MLCLQPWLSLPGRGAEEQPHRPRPFVRGIPVMGGQQRPQFPGQQPQQLPKWVVMNQIEDFFEVKDVPLNSKEIPKDVDVLMLIQPAGLQADTAFAIDQFALRGGRVLAFVDPVPDVGRMMNPGAAGAASSPELVKLFKAWGKSG